jgi:hypothetical protein
MTDRENASCLLQQWLALTRAESEAIQASKWIELQEIQSRKTSLRQPLTETLQQWKPEENPFRGELGRLIALESRNEQMLVDRREKLREKRAALERASKNLRNVRRSYVASASTGWNSYS